jgi:hypothetical protein
LTDPWRIRQARHWCPVRYVVFDLLYHGGRCLLREVVKAGRDFDLLAQNDLGEAVMASPAVSGGEFFIRSDRHLYCIQR